MEMKQKEEKETLWVKIRPFIFGGVSGMIATVLTQPIDTVKVRIQILGESLTKITSPKTPQIHKK